MQNVRRRSNLPTIGEAMEYSMLQAKLRSRMDMNQGIRLDEMSIFASNTHLVNKMGFGKEEVYVHLV